MVENNAYISIGDPYQDPSANTFRETKKTEKPLKPFQIKQYPENEQNGEDTDLMLDGCVLFSVNADLPYNPSYIHHN